MHEVTDLDRVRLYRRDEVKERHHQVTRRFGVEADKASERRGIGHPLDPHSVELGDLEAIKILHQYGIEEGAQERR